MSIITLTTDWGDDGIYVGAFKGKLHSYNPKVTVVDISHSVKPFDIGNAAFIIRTSFRHFPEGTIHILGVGGNIDINKSKEFIVIEYYNHYFIGVNDGLWGVVFQSMPARAHLIDIPKAALEKYSAFPELEVYSIVATGILKGMKLDDFGKPLKNLKKLNPHLPIIDTYEMKGHVIYFDTYGNALTNIEKEEFNTACKNRDFEIFISSRSYVIRKINDTYHETKKGQLLSIFSYSGLLEIAICNGNIKNLLNLDLYSEIIIKFYDHKKTDAPELPAQGKLFG